MKDTQNHQSDSATSSTTSVDSKRRRLFGLGVATPVILTLSSRTAWGGALCAPSAFNSVTFASHHPTEAQNCSVPAGLSPDSWINAPWPSPYMPDVDSGLQSSEPAPDQTTACQAVAGSTFSGQYNGQYANTLGDVICRSPSQFNLIFGVSVLPENRNTLSEALIYFRGGNSPLGGDIEAHAVAALLNAASGRITVGEPSIGTAVAKVVEIFSALMSGAGYTLSTGQTVYWDQDPNNVGFTMSAYFTNYSG